MEIQTDIAIDLKSGTCRFSLVRGLGLLGLRPWLYSGTIDWNAHDLADCMAQNLTTLSLYVVASNYDVGGYLYPFEEPISPIFTTRGHAENYALKELDTWQNNCQEVTQEYILFEEVLLGHTFALFVNGRKRHTHDILEGELEVSELADAMQEAMNETRIL